MKSTAKACAESDAQHADVPVPAWERRSGEPTRWFARFNFYRLLGSSRSIDGAWRQEPKEKTNKNGRAPDSWHKAAKRFQWRDRALAWDIADAQQLSQQVVVERARRLKLTLQERQRRERYLVGLDRTFRYHAARLSNSNKLEAEKYARSVEWSEARLQAHFTFVERIIRLSHGEFAEEEKLLAELAAFQSQHVEVTEVYLQHPALSDQHHGHLELSRVPVVASHSIGDGKPEESVAVTPLSRPSVQKKITLSSGSRSQRVKKSQN